jgi:hypothetical protein
LKCFVHNNDLKFRLRGRFALRCDDFEIIEEPPKVDIENEDEADDNYYDFRAALIEHYSYCRTNKLNGWISNYLNSFISIFFSFIDSIKKQFI